jgi:hypothetical protein
MIGKSLEGQTQLAIMSCELTSMKNQVFSIALQPDMVRIEPNVRISSIGSFEKVAGFGLANAKIKIEVADLLNKKLATIYYKRGADRKWVLEGIQLTEDFEIDRSVLRERRRKLRKMIGD